MSEAGSFRPLAGVRVLAWEQAVALPMATRLLADLGAEVIRLDAPGRGAGRPRHLANDLVRNKQGLAIDLRQTEGQHLLKRLVGAVDIFCENFTPRVKRQFGLTYEELRAEHPELIMLSLTGYGQSGAWSERPTYGPGIEAASGHAQSMGYPDAPPTRPGTIVFGDNISGFYAALALIGALHQRRTTGHGAYIDLSMYEANAFHLGPSIARSSLSGLPQERRGNCDPAALVQGVYASSEPERWVAITVSQDQSGALADLLDASATSPESSEALHAWVAARSADAAADLLQRAGIAASPVLNARDALLNEQLRHREAYTLVQHDGAVNGYAAHPHAASPFRVTGRPRPSLHEAPAPGQHTRTVLRNLLQMTDAEVEALFARGVISMSGPAAATGPGTDPLVQRKLDWQLIAGYDDDPGAVLGLDQAEPRA